jgi:hypothetical protein
MWLANEERYIRASKNLSLASVMIPDLSHSLHPTAREIVLGFKEPLPGTAMSAAEEKVRSAAHEVPEIER